MRSEAERRMRESECETVRHQNPHLKNNSAAAAAAAAAASSKIRAVDLLIIEKHQHVSPASHHLPHTMLCCGPGGLGAWPPGEHSPALPPPFPPPLLEDFVLL